MRELRPDRKIPEEVEELVMKALSKKPQERFDSAEAFKQHLAEAYIAAGIGVPQSSFQSGPQEYFDPQAEMVSAETFDMPKRDWPVADSTSFPLGQLPHIEGADGYAGIDSGANYAALDTGAAAHTGDQLRPQHDLKQTGAAQSQTDQHPINRELPVDSRAIHRDSAAHNAVPEGFVSYDSGRYNIALSDHSEDQKEFDEFDDDDQLHVQRSYRPIIGALSLLFIGGIWAMFVMSSWPKKPSGVQSLLPQAGAICGTKKNAWRKGAFRLLVLPLVSDRVPVTLDVQGRVRWQRMRELHKRNIKGIKKIAGVLGRDFLSVHESRKGLDQPGPTVNHQRAQMYGELCKADMVLTGGWLTANGNQPTAPPDAQSSKMPTGWVRQFASFTGRRLQLLINGQIFTLDKPHDFDELIQSNTKQFPGPRTAAVLRGMVALKAAQRMAKSRYISAYLLQKAMTAFKEAQIFRLDRLPVLKRIKLSAVPPRPVIHVPAGRFWMGPPDKARLTEIAGFWIDQYEVSREAYAACVLQGKCPVMHNFLSKDWMLPRDRVTTEAAKAFCTFEGKVLPTEKQWIKAARGGLTINGKPNPFPKRIYPWGNNKHTCPYAHALRCYRKQDEGDLIAVMLNVRRKLKGVSPYGVAHMLGNAAEILVDGTIKGGSGYGAPVPISWKNHMDQRSGLSWVGFRCLRNR